MKMRLFLRTMQFKKKNNFNHEISFVNFGTPMKYKNMNYVINFKIKKDLLQFLNMKIKIIIRPHYCFVDLSVCLFKINVAHHTI